MRDLYPRTADLPGVEDTGLDEYLDRFKSEAPPIMYTGLIAGSALYQITPIATVRKPVPAAMLSEEDKELHAQRLTKTNIYPLRQAIFLVKMIAGMCWGQDDAVRERMHIGRYEEGDPGTWRTE